MADRLNKSSPARDGTQAKVVTKATASAAANLEIPNNVLARMLGLSEPTISRMRMGKYVLSANSKPFELSVLFVRLFRGLDAIVGGDAVAARSWLRSENTALHDVPLNLIQKADGLTQVIQYVDARRARI